MNRSNFRIAVFSTGIVSTLLIACYLPVLIWSPPWGENGYYQVYGDDRNFHHFHKGSYRLIHTHNNTLSKQQMQFIKVGNIWTAKNRISYFKEDIIALFENSNLIITRTSLDDPENIRKARYYKNKNPFILWRIKWIEWTAEAP